MCRPSLFPAQLTEPGKHDMINVGGILMNQYAILCQTESGSWYQIDTSEFTPRVLRWSGHTILGFHEPHENHRWQEIEVTSVRIPAYLGFPMWFKTKDNTQVTTAPVIAMIRIDGLNKTLDPKIYGHVESKT